MKLALTITMMLLAAALIGCVGSEPEPQAPTPNQPTPEQETPPTEPTPTEPETPPSEQPETGSWCEAGTQWTYTGQSGGTAGTTSFEIKGFETYNGKQMCHAVATNDYGGQKMQMDYYFDESEEEVCFVMTDLNTGQEMSSGCVTG